MVLMVMVLVGVVIMAMIMFKALLHWKTWAISGARIGFLVRRDNFGNLLLGPENEKTIMLGMMMREAW